MADAPLRTLFITGFGRSGTTILESILGQLPGVFSAGELAYIWDRGLEQDRRCACGAPFAQCAVWPAVVREAFGGEVPDAAALVAARESLTPRRALALALGRRPLPPPAAAYLERLRQLYRGLRQVTGCRVVIDSSKSPGHGFLLGKLSELDVHVVHLVRDPRATAYAWQKRKVYDASGSEPLAMSRHTPARSARLWLTWNLAAELLWARESYTRIRYEDFVARPREVVEGVLGRLGLPVPELPFVSDHAVRLGPTHAVAGNPSRFTTGVVELRLDDEWRQALAPGSRRLVSLLTWPLMLRYGYRWRGSSS